MFVGELFLGWGSEQLWDTTHVQVSVDGTPGILHVVILLTIIYIAINKYGISKKGSWYKEPLKHLGHHSLNFILNISFSKKKKQTNISFSLLIGLQYLYPQTVSCLALNSSWAFYYKRFSQQHRKVKRLVQWSSVRPALRLNNYEEFPKIFFILPYMYMQVVGEPFEKSCRTHGPSLPILNYASTKDILLQNHNATIISKKMNSNVLIYKQPTFWFSQLLPKCLLEILPIPSPQTKIQWRFTHCGFIILSS